MLTGTAANELVHNHILTNVVVFYALGLLIITIILIIAFIKGYKGK